MATLTIEVPDGCPEFGSRFANTIKLQLLLSQANAALAALFRQRWLAYDGANWDDDSDGNVTKFKTGIGHKFYKVVKKNKIQRTTLMSGNVDSWDVPMLVDILTQVEFHTCEGVTCDLQEKDHLAELKKVRNDSAHNPNMETSDEELEALWRRAEPALVFFGKSSENLRQLKNSTNVAEFENQNTAVVNFANSKKATELKDAGNAFYRDKKFKKAIEAYTSAILLGGLSQVDLAVLYSNRSVTYVDLSKQRTHTIDEPAAGEARHQSLKDAKEVMRLRPAWYKGYFRAGKAYHALGKNDKARRAFEWSLSLAPGREEILVARDKSRRKLGIDTRNENMEPRRGRYTAAEMRNMLEEKVGILISEEKFQKLRQSREWLIKGQADVNKGHDFYDGTADMKQDYDMAVRHYTKAAMCGNAEGLYNLGRMYQTGIGIQRDRAMAMTLYEDAASKPAFHYANAIKGPVEPMIGVMESMHALGFMYEVGIGVGKDYQEACMWYEKASKLGFPRSSNSLACLYQKGKGVPKDTNKAGNLRYLSSVQAHSHAMGVMASYLPNFGQGVPKSVSGYQHKQAIKAEDSQAQKKQYEIDHLVDKLVKYVKENIKLVGECEPDDFKADEPKSGPRGTSYASHTSDLNAALTHQNRVAVITEHRKLLRGRWSSIEPRTSQRRAVTASSANAWRHKQGAPAQLAGLRSITFREMEATGTQVYKNCVLAVRSVEAPCEGSGSGSDNPSMKGMSIMLVLEDRNRDVCRAVVHNVDSDDARQVMDKLGFGARMSIINPNVTVRLRPSSRECVVVLDDMSAVLFHSGPSPAACRFCGEENAALKCSTCKIAFYCDRECQIADWNVLQHKLVCQPNSPNSPASAT